jgi:ankyrin repeat protein
MFKRYELLGLLKSYKCDVFLQDLNGHTVLHQLALDTRPNHQVTTGWNALIDSLSDDDVKKLVNMKDAKGRTVLHICALHQNEELVRLLFNKLPAEDVHIQPDSSGYTAFHLAISRPSEFVSQSLVFYFPFFFFFFFFFA